MSSFGSTFPMPIIQLMCIYVHVGMPMFYNYHAQNNKSKIAKGPPKRNKNEGYTHNILQIIIE